MEWLEAIDFSAFLAWLDAEVLPHLASVSVILGVALAELIPAVRALCKARTVFASVAAEADGYRRDKVEYDRRMEALERERQVQLERLNETVARYEGRLAESEGRLARALSQIESHAEKTERMVYLGMTNSPELVTNGAARAIAEIEEEANEEANEDANDASLQS